MRRPAGHFWRVVSRSAQRLLCPCCGVHLVCAAFEDRCRVDLMLWLERFGVGFELPRASGEPARVRDRAARARAGRLVAGRRVVGADAMRSVSTPSARRLSFWCERRLWSSVSRSSGLRAGIQGLPAAVVGDGGPAWVVDACDGRLLGAAGRDDDGLPGRELLDRGWVGVVFVAAGASALPRLDRGKDACHGLLGWYPDWAGAGDRGDRFGALGHVWRCATIASRLPSTWSCSPPWPAACKSASSLVARIRLNPAPRLVASRSAAARRAAK